ncbi:MAG: hypothetical protein DBY32_03030, partial [Phascolarctobacterium sp.]
VVNIFFKKVSKLFSNLFLSPSRTTAILVYHFFNALSRSFLNFFQSIFEIFAASNNSLFSILNFIYTVNMFFKFF